MSAADQVAIEEVVTLFLKQRTGSGRIERTTKLFEVGLIDSLFVLEILTFLESRFEFKASSKDLDLSHFQSIEHMSLFVVSKQPPRTR